MQRPSQIHVNVLDIPGPLIPSLPTWSRLFLFMHSQFMIHHADMYAGRYLEADFNNNTYYWVFWLNLHSKICLYENLYS